MEGKGPRYFSASGTKPAVTTRPSFRSRSLTSDRRIWCMGDPRWKDKTRPLLEALATPMTWEHLTKWAISQKMSGSILRNGIAYLEGTSCCHAFQDDLEVWWWVASDVDRNA